MIDNQPIPANSKPRVLIISILIGLAVLLLGGMLVANVENNRLQSRQRAAATVAAEVADEINDRLSRSLSATYALAAVVRQGQGDIKEFDRLAVEMLRLYGGISSLQLAPDGIIRAIVPLAGNEKAIGHNLLEEDTGRNKETLLALRTRQLTLAGPFELIQGGVAIIGYQPVFITEPGGKERFWGFTSAMIRISELLKVVNMQRFVERGYGYEISRVHPETGVRQVFARSGSAVVSPVLRTMEVPNGTWTLAVSPLAGWYSSELLALEIVAVLLFSLFVALLFYWLLSLPLRLQTMIEERTDQLTASNEQLQREILERELAQREQVAIQAELLASEERYRSIIENMQDVYYRSDAEGRLIMISPSGAALLGYETPEQMLGMVIRDTFYHDPDDRDAFISNLKMKGALAGYEVTLKRKDGTPLPVATSTHLLFDADGGYCGVEGVFRDISEERRASEALRASEEKFSKAFSQAPLLMSISDIETGCYLEVNDKFCQVSGYSQNDLIGRTSMELGWISSAERDRMVGMLKRDGRVQDIELALTAKTGRTVICLYSAEIIHVDGTNRLLSIALDITQRKSDLVALDYANECFQQALSGSQHILYRLNVRKGGYDYLSPVFEQITGYPLAEFMQTSLEKLAGYFHPEDRERVFGMLDKQMAERSGRTINFDLEYRFRKADGGYCWLHDLTTACFDEQGELECFFGSAMDVTERKGTEELLRESEERYRILFNAESDAIVVIDAETLQHVDVNDSAVEMYGYSRQELLQIRSTDLSAEPEETERCIAGGQGLVVIPVRYHRKKDGTVFPVEITARYFEFGGRTVLLAAMRDISEIQKLQWERDKAQRLESLGLLAGGIAHDFNNILTGIIGNLSLIRVMIDSGHRAAARLDECEKAAIRAGELTQQLLTFARGGEPVKKTMDVVRLIEESVSFTLRGSNVRAELDIAHDLWAVEADEGQINQVLNNLLINAVQAMPGGGVVTVRAENETGTKGSERHVCISISDSGDGIPDEILPRIFDPYFSTKAEGTGLGLASVYSIVTRHGGSVTVSSEAGCGSEFVVRLPAAAHPPALEQVDDEQHSGSCPINRVLVMDDEAMIRDVASLMLSEMGCGVDTCADGREALVLYRAALSGPAPYDAVILDLTVPGGMGGLETAERILALDPLAVLIVSSGYSQDAVSADFSSHGFSGAVMKPYTMEMFSAELGRVVASRRSAAATL